jgi:hypothetical protein
MALEMLVKESLELPAFSTLDEISSRIRREVNTGMFEQIDGRIGLPDRVGLKSLLDVSGADGKTPFNRLKQVAGRASWSGLREQVEYLRWVDSLGDTAGWLEGIAEPKIADFAGEALAADAGVMSDVAPLKRIALLACAVHVAKTRARDDLAEMFCKRMAQVTKHAKAELAEIHERQADISDRLITNYPSVLACLDPRTGEQPTRPSRCAGRGGRSSRRAGSRRSSPTSRRWRRITRTTNMPLVAGHRRRDRPTMFAFVSAIELEWGFPSSARWRRRPWGARPAERSCWIRSRGCSPARLVSIPPTSSRCASTRSSVNSRSSRRSPSTPCRETSSASRASRSPTRSRPPARSAAARRRRQGEHLR